MANLTIKNDTFLEPLLRRFWLVPFSHPIKLKKFRGFEMF